MAEETPLELGIREGKMNTEHLAEAVWGWGFRVWSLELRVGALGFRVKNSGFRIQVVVLLDFMSAPCPDIV